MKQENDGSKYKQHHGGVDTITSDTNHSRKRNRGTTVRVTPNQPRGISSIKQSSNIDQLIEELEKRIQAEKPSRSYAPPLSQRVAFRALPLSEPTLLGLETTSNKNPTTKTSHSNKKKTNQSSTTSTTSSSSVAFTTMTAIQNACIPHALAGRDILGAAKTGSGKTLAFLIPVLEVLYRNRYSAVDGVGAVIIVPTRELAVQIFTVLKRVGKFHSRITVGLLIGGKKDFYMEQQHVGSTNIIIATPGRLLQHLEQTPTFDVSNTRMLVLDEADRILDMGFREQLLRILDYFPKSTEDNNDDDDDDSSSNSTNHHLHPQNTRLQTLLFSATQTRDVSALATLSLRKPVYIGVHDREKVDTPETLQHQAYVIVPTEHKLDAIYSFIKSHLKCKSIIFMNTCAQVRYAYDLLCMLRPGITILALHGKLSQERRTQIYADIVKSENNDASTGGTRRPLVLLATDVAARGLDVPNIDWVVQMDAPEDRDTYIHRVGRTARYRSTGKALLLLTPAEERNGFIENLLQKNTTNNSSKNKIPLQKSSINPTKASATVSVRVASAVASNVRLNELAKKAFHSYLRCIHLMPRRDIFRVEDIDVDAYSQSLGLASTPKLKVPIATATKIDHREEFRQTKNVNKKLQRLKEQIKIEKLNKKIQNCGHGSEKDNKRAEHKNKANKRNHDNDDDEEEDDDEVLLPKPKTANDDDNQDNNLTVLNTSQTRHPKRIRTDGATVTTNRRIVFNDDGEAEDESNIFQTIISNSSNITLNNSQNDIVSGLDEYRKKIRERLDQTKALDERDYKERILLKKLKKKNQLKQMDDMGDYNARDIGGATLIQQQQQSSDESNHDFDDVEDDDDDDNNDAYHDNGTQKMKTKNKNSHTDAYNSYDEDSSVQSDGDTSSSAILQQQEEMALAIIQQNRKKNTN